MSNEEVRRVSEALDAIERIADPEERVHAMSQAMAAQVKRTAKWKEERRELVLKLKAEDVSIRKIAARIGTSPSTVQDILRGYSGSGTHRPRKAAEE
ncbi:helix-turn-helix domain-containing protein [Streptomyces sp. NPDC102274]|uniref:helix-turn-helix domain-containing protein n=1 Tax=Streptomyces sp. NPDC102274 TaxID=3366151 RepID=UPI003814FF57